MKRCKWCKRFVRRDQPAFTWYRTFRHAEFTDGIMTSIGPVLGWTEPQVLCPECAESAATPVSWVSVFAEVES